MFFAVDDSGFNGINSSNTMGRINGKVTDLKCPVWTGGIFFRLFK
jgi:hypothetical protein